MFAALAVSHWIETVVRNDDGSPVVRATPILSSVQMSSNRLARWRSSHAGPSSPTVILSAVGGMWAPAHHFDAVSGNPALTESTGGQGDSVSMDVARCGGCWVQCGHIGPRSGRGSSQITGR